MNRYPALIDGKSGNYGVSFPDLPGCVAMGRTVDEAILNAEESLREWAKDYEARGANCGALLPWRPLQPPRGPSSLTYP